MNFMQEKRERKAVLEWLISRGIKATVSHEDGWLNVAVHSPKLKPQAMERLGRELLLLTGRHGMKPDGRIVVT